MEKPGEILTQLDAMVTLTQEFPMDIFSKQSNIQYTSMFDYIQDILSSLGYSQKDVLIFLINAIFKVDISEKYDEGTEKLQAYLLDKISNLSEVKESKFLTKLEDSVKTIIMNILTGIFSCSAIPWIMDRDMDYNKDGKDNYPIYIPDAYIDFSNMLLVSPLSIYGKNYYNISDENVSNANTLYRTKDLNAFIWYVMNRGNNKTQVGLNKMMWDSRRQASLNSINRDISGYTEWINSKQTNEGSLTYSGDKNNTFLYPIMQLQPAPSGLYVSFPYQTYHGEGKLNKTMYQFNEDYLKSIKIFDTKVILTYFIEYIFGFSFAVKDIDISLERTFLMEKIKSVIKSAIEADDMEVSDCYYTFSNEEYDRMLNQTILNRYNAKTIAQDGLSASTYDVNDIINQLDSINADATSTGKTTKITKLVTSAASISVNKNWPSYSFDFYDGRHLDKEFITGLVIPLAQSLLTPQILLLFEINFVKLGLVNFNNQLIPDTNGLINFFLNKMMGIIVSLVKYIKDEIAILLLDLIEEQVVDLIAKDKLTKTITQYKFWIQLLNEAMIALRIYRGGRRNRYIRASDAIDDVDYADITNEQTIPESTTNCNGE